MKLRILSFGIAKDIMKERKMEVEYQVQTIQDLKSKLCLDYPEFNKLASLSLAINESYQADDFLLSENDEVAIIPPVAGG